MLDAPWPCGGVLPVRARLLRKASRLPRRCFRLRARPVRARFRGAVRDECALRRDEPRANSHRQQHHRRVADMRRHRGAQGRSHPRVALVRPARLHRRQGGVPFGARLPEGGDDARGGAPRGAGGGRSGAQYRRRSVGHRERARSGKHPAPNRECAAEGFHPYLLVDRAIRRDVGLHAKPRLGPARAHGVFALPLRQPRPCACRHPRGAHHGVLRGDGARPDADALQPRHRDAEADFRNRCRLRRVSREAAYSRKVGSVSKGESRIPFEGEAQEKGRNA